ncbi:MAG: hypothetical protein HOP19_29665 [Acidobacteria bacterium]|nr:hypothetical protein [Acidobacteriota bacterium]
MFNRFYLILGIAIVAAYAFITFNGWELGSPTPQQLPAEARNAPGGYRSFHFWHEGYQGGK